MKTITARTLELSGSSHEKGQALGRIAVTNPMMKNFYTAGYENFGTNEVQEATNMFDVWCPGLNEELAGFACELAVPLKSVVYYAMTYLKPNCSHLALLPFKTANGHPLIARSYEFNDELEDFHLIKTSVKGKYTHMGTSVLSFGREDDFNEHGLAVTMSSCGFPVGANKCMRRPGLKGLQYWTVIRSIQENCRDTREALLFLKGMPIAFNINLILLDRSGNGALVETLDGNTADRSEPLTVIQLKEMLLSPYPDGLCCRYYKDFFGTTKSMIIDPADGIIDLCWGGRSENGWHTYRISEPLPTTENTISIACKACRQGNSLYNMNGDALFTEVAAVEVSSFDGLPDQLIPKIIKGGHYAVFTHTGSLSLLQDSYSYIWGTWFLGTSEKLDEREDFELYDQRFLEYDHPESQIDLISPSSNAAALIPSAVRTGRTPAWTAGSGSVSCYVSRHASRQMSPMCPLTYSKQFHSLCCHRRQRHTYPKHSMTSHSVSPPANGITPGKKTLQNQSTSLHRFPLEPYHASQISSYPYHHR